MAMNGGGMDMCDACVYVRIVDRNYLYYDVCISFHFCIKAFCKQLITYKSLLVFHCVHSGVLSHAYTWHDITPSTTTTIYILTCELAR